MPKVNPFTFARPMEARKTVSFTDPRYPESPVTMTFRSPDIVDYTAIKDRAIEFFNEYSSKPFPAVDGRIVEINQTLAEAVASIVVLQEGAVEDRYTMEEVVAMTITMPSVYARLANEVTKLTEESDLGKLIKTKTPSLEPSQDGKNDTQNLT